MSSPSPSSSLSPAAAGSSSSSALVSPVASGRGSRLKNASMNLSLSKVGILPPGEAEKWQREVESLKKLNSPGSRNRRPQPLDKVLSVHTGNGPNSPGFAPASPNTYLQSTTISVPSTRRGSLASPKPFLAGAEDSPTLNSPLISSRAGKLEMKERERRKSVVIVSEKESEDKDKEAASVDGQAAVEGSAEDAQSPGQRMRSASLAVSAAMGITKKIQTKIESGAKNTKDNKSGLDADQMAKLKSQSVAIVQKPPAERSKTEIQTLVSWVSTAFNSVLLKELDPPTLFALCGRMIYSAHAAQTTIIYQGAESDSLYIIVSGTISIWVNQNKEAASMYTATTDSDEKKEEKEKEKTNANQTTQNKHNNPTKAPETAALQEMEQELVTVNGHSYYKPRGMSNVLFIGCMSAGEEKSSFGELGLITGQPRSATIKTETDCEFLVVNKTDFHEVLSQYSKQVQEQVAVVRSFDGFNNLNEAHLQRLALYFKKRVVPPRTDIFTQGQMCKYVYFVTEGECCVLVTAPNGLSYQVALVCAGQICGEHAILNPKQSKGLYDHTLRTNTVCTVYYIHRDHFLRRISGVILGRFRTRLRDKMRWRDARLAEIMARTGEAQPTVAPHLAGLNPMVAKFLIPGRPQSRSQMLAQQLAAAHKKTKKITSAPQRRGSSEFASPRLDAIAERPAAPVSARYHPDRAEDEKTRSMPLPPPSGSPVLAGLGSSPQKSRFPYLEGHDVNLNTSPPLQSLPRFRHSHVYRQTGVTMNEDLDPTSARRRSITAINQETERERLREREVEREDAADTPFQPGVLAPSSDKKSLVPSFALPPQQRDELFHDLVHSFNSASVSTTNSTRHDLQLKLYARQLARRQSQLEAAKIHERTHSPEGPASERDRGSDGAVNDGNFALAISAVASGNLEQANLGLLSPRKLLESHIRETKQALQRDSQRIQLPFGLSSSQVRTAQAALQQKRFRVMMTELKRDIPIGLQTAVQLGVSRSGVKLPAMEEEKQTNRIQIVKAMKMQPKESKHGRSSSLDSNGSVSSRVHLTVPQAQ